MFISNQPTTCSRSLKVAEKKFVYRFMKKYGGREGPKCYEIKKMLRNLKNCYGIKKNALRNLKKSYGIKKSVAKFETTTELKKMLRN